MRKAISFPPERAEQALAKIQTLVELSNRQLDMCSQVLEELEFTGELQQDFMKRLVRIQSDVRKARAELKLLAAAPADEGA